MKAAMHTSSNALPLGNGGFESKFYIKLRAESADPFITRILNDIMAGSVKRKPQMIVENQYFDANNQNIDY
jgi:hypothetical protein